MSAKVSQELGGTAAMNVSTQGELIIDNLIIHEDLKPKTLKEYAGDLKQFISWLYPSQVIIVLGLIVS